MINNPVVWNHIILTQGAVSTKDDALGVGDEMLWYSLESSSSPEGSMSLKTTEDCRIYHSACEYFLPSDGNI